MKNRVFAEKQPHFTGFELTREHHCDGLLFCTSTLAVIKYELRVVLTPASGLLKMYKITVNKTTARDFLIFV